jgi:hypothetical protein
MQPPDGEPQVTQPTTGEFTDEQLTQAILHAEDILTRSQLPFLVLGDTAFQMYNNMPLSGHRIVLGVMQRHCQPECTSLMTILDPEIEQMSDGWRLIFEKVPVYIKIITKDYTVLHDLDVIFSHYEAWRIPNPFEEYWKGPHLDI